MLKRIAAVAFLFLVVILLTGCSHPYPSTVVEITCKPKFEYKPRPELIVSTRDGDRRDAFDQFLILCDGNEQFRIPWGTQPISHGPVALSVHQTYTFRLDTVQNTILSVQEGKRLIYAAPK